jgi:hypothetical protein
MNRDMAVFVLRGCYPTDRRHSACGWNRPVIRPALHLAMLVTITATVGLNGSGWVVGSPAGWW